MHFTGYKVLPVMAQRYTFLFNNIVLPLTLIRRIAPIGAMHLVPGRRAVSRRFYDRLPARIVVGKRTNSRSFDSITAINASRRVFSELN